MQNPVKRMNVPCAKSKKKSSVISSPVFLYFVCYIMSCSSETGWTQTSTSFTLQIRAHHTAASVLASTKPKGSNDLGTWGEEGNLELILMGGECRTTPEGKLQAPEHSLLSYQTLLMQQKFKDKNHKTTTAKH